MVNPVTTDTEATSPQSGGSGLLGRYIDLGRVGPLLQSFSDSAGVASAVIDLDGHVLTAARWQPLCVEFHRRHPETLRRCIESDTSLAARMRVGDRAAVYTCLNGLTDAAAPIIVDGRHLANAFVGQFLTAPPDVDFFARQAERFGFDRESYLRALAQVPVLSKEKACAALEFIASSAGMLTDMGREGLMKEQAEQRLRRTLERLRKSVDAAVGALTHTVEMRDPYTAGHQERVSELSVAIGRKLALRSRSITSLRIAGLIHDLGKIAVPAEILSKPGALTEHEWRLLREHPETAFRILREMRFPGPVARIVRDHHERLDGSGYPRGITGEAVHVESRIIAVADVVEAMSSHRPYRPALGIGAALAEIQAGRDTTLDSQAVDACVDLFRRDGFAFSQAS